MGSQLFYVIVISLVDGYKGKYKTTPFESNINTEVEKINMKLE